MILQVREVSKTYQQAHKPIHALKTANLDLDANERLAIVGPSGSGKTTLLSLIAGLDSPSQGQIIIKGTDITRLSQHDLTQFRGKHIGIIFQQFHLMPHLTALENVSLPLQISGEDNAEDRAAVALEQVGLKDRGSHFPSQLSGGECQRVAIARAIVVEPDILLADEPSGNLDTETGKKVMDLIFSIADQNNMTLLLITHDRDLAKRCHRQVSINGGQLL